MSRSQTLVPSTPNLTASNMGNILLSTSTSGLLSPPISNEFMPLNTVTSHGGTTPRGPSGHGVVMTSHGILGKSQLPVIYLTVEKRASAPRVYDIPIESIDTWEKFLSVLLHICPPEAKALLISSDGPGGGKSYIIPATWDACLISGREFLLQLGSCIKDPDCPVCFKLHREDSGKKIASGGDKKGAGGDGGKEGKGATGGGGGGGGSGSGNGGKRGTMVVMDMNHDGVVEEDTDDGFGFDDDDEKFLLEEEEDKEADEEGDRKQEQQQQQQQEQEQEQLQEQIDGAIWSKPETKSEEDTWGKGHPGKPERQPLPFINDWASQIPDNYVIETNSTNPSSSSPPKYSWNTSNGPVYPRMPKSTSKPPPRITGPQFYLPNHGPNSRWGPGVFQQRGTFLGPIPGVLPPPEGFNPRTRSLHSNVEAGIDGSCETKMVNIDGMIGSSFTEDGKGNGENQFMNI